MYAHFAGNARKKSKWKFHHRMKTNKTTYSGDTSLQQEWWRDHNQTYEPYRPHSMLSAITKAAL
jgi:hypothetical protein